MVNACHVTSLICILKYVNEARGLGLARFWFSRARALARGVVIGARCAPGAGPPRSLSMVFNENAKFLMFNDRK